MDLSKRADRYAADNVEAARIILADVERHGGETSLMVIVARATLAAVWHGPDQGSRIEAPTNGKSLT
jgi:hypothetical protein